MMNGKLKVKFLFILSVLMSCKKPYNPPAITGNKNYLVIEGMINIGTDSTIIKLSRTVSISSGNTVNPELNAQVNVENDQSASYPLKELGGGRYALAALNAGITPKYRLRIKTSDNNEYLSDYVVAKASPAIDSLSKVFDGSAENIYSYTHDPANNTKYYRWEYQETYLYKSPIYSNYVFKNGNVVQTTPADQIDTCYISDNSSTILLNTTAKLQQDIINKNPITKVPITLDKLKIRYSILVKQYALTPEAYNFYENLAKNTENLGSIFDALPSEVGGNIHCISNPSLTAIGFICAGTTSQLRIFIDRADFFTSKVGVDYSYCGIASIQYTGTYFPIPQIIVGGFFTPTTKISRDYDPKKRDSVFSLSYADPGCTDCTLKGSNKRPAFWK